MLLSQALTTKDTSVINSCIISVDKQFSTGCDNYQKIPTTIENLPKTKLPITNLNPNPEPYKNQSPNPKP